MEIADPLLEMTVHTVSILGKEQRNRVPADRYKSRMGLQWTAKPVSPSNTLIVSERHSQDTSHKNRYTYNDPYTYRTNTVFFCLY
jgi:hypothetical protein